jgi:hypothetical protein
MEGFHHKEMINASGAGNADDLDFIIIHCIFINYYTVPHECIQLKMQK